MGDADVPGNWPIKRSYTGEGAVDLARDLTNLNSVIIECLDCLDAEISQSSTAAVYLGDIRCAIDCACQIASELSALDRGSSIDAAIGLDRTVVSVRAILSRLSGPQDWLHPELVCGIRHRRHSSA